MKNTWAVRLPITGYVELEVEDCEDEEEAIEKALQGDGVKLDSLVEWEATSIVVEGNVFHGMLNRADAECVEGEEPDED
jgi:hypothetical protein